MKRPVRAWYQNLVSWNGCIKGFSPGSTTLSPSPGNRSAHFIHGYFSYLTPFVVFSPTAKPCPRLISHKIELVSSVMEHSTHERFCWLAHDCNYCDENYETIISKVDCIDFVTDFDTILTSRQRCEKLQCLYENLMLNNFRKTTLLKKIWFVN